MNAKFDRNPVLNRINGNIKFKIQAQAKLLSWVLFTCYPYWSCLHRYHAFPPLIRFTWGFITFCRLCPQPPVSQILKSYNIFVNVFIKLCMLSGTIKHSINQNLMMYSRIISEFHWSCRAQKFILQSSVYYKLTIMMHPSYVKKLFTSTKIHL